MNRAWYYFFYGAGSMLMITALHIVPFSKEFWLFGVGMAMVITAAENNRKVN